MSTPTKPVPAAPTPADPSLGMHANVAAAHAALANTATYDTPFADAVVALSGQALRHRGRRLFAVDTDRGPVLAVACATHDPATGLLRPPGERAFGPAFLTEHLLRVSTAARTSGRGPARRRWAALELLGGRGAAVAARAERAELAGHIRALIAALEARPLITTAGR